MFLPSEIAAIRSESFAPRGVLGFSTFVTRVVADVLDLAGDFFRVVFLAGPDFGLDERFDRSETLLLAFVFVFDIEFHPIDRPSHIQLLANARVELRAVGLM